MHEGSCLCGAVSFRVEGSLQPVEACHCVQCRKWTGHALFSTEIPRASLQVDGKENIRWYRSSEKVRRGFCGQCGSPLFFDPLDRIKHDWTAVSMGAFDAPTGTRLAQHIFVAEKGDYYEIDDDLPKNEY